MGTFKTVNDYSTAVLERNVCLGEKEKGEAKLGCSLLQEETSS